MTRVATEAWAQSTAQRIAERTGDPRRKYRGGASGASSCDERQSRWQGDTTSCCQAMPLSVHASQGQDPQGGGCQVLVVRGRKGTDPPPPVHGVQGLAAPD